MEALRTFGAALPEAARDIKLNLQSVFTDTSLSESQRWGVALASAIAARNTGLRDAVLQDGAEHLEDAVREDAQAAAALMAMNNIYYRFRHIVGNPAYQQLPARLRMNRIASPQGSKLDFELYCLAVSAINNCEMCIRTHEKTVLAGGITVHQVHDAIRIAATIYAAAVAMESIPADATGF